jgi:hypothetical protein
MPQKDEVAAVFTAVAALKLSIYEGKLGWDRRNTTKPRGMTLTCPKGHCYEGRSLADIEHAICQDAPAERNHCQKVRTYIIFS